MPLKPEQSPLLSQAIVNAILNDTGRPPEMDVYEIAGTIENMEKNGIMNMVDVEDVLKEAENAMGGFDPKDSLSKVAYDQWYAAVEGLRNIRDLIKSNSVQEWMKEAQKYPGYEPKLAAWHKQWDAIWKIDPSLRAKK